MKLELILGGYFERLPSKRGPCPMLLLSPFSDLEPLTARRLLVNRGIFCLGPVRDQF